VTGHDKTPPPPRFVPGHSRFRFFRYGSPAARGRRRSGASRGAPPRRAAAGVVLQRT